MEWVEKKAVVSEVEAVQSVCMGGLPRSQCSLWAEVMNRVHHRTGHEGPEGEKRNNSILSLTSALDGVGGQRHVPAALPLGKSRYPLYKRLGGHQGRSGRVRKISHPSEFEPRTVQPVASHYRTSRIQRRISSHY
jgi:hypothetical protein